MVGQRRSLLCQFRLVSDFGSGIIIGGLCCPPAEKFVRLSNCFAMKDETRCEGTVPGKHK